MEPGESIAETIVREVREETGIEARVEKVIGVYSNPRHVAARVYVSRRLARASFPRWRTRVRDSLDSGLTAELRSSDVVKEMESSGRGG